MSDFLTRLETLTEEAVKAYVDAWVNWRMKDWFDFTDWLPNSYYTGDIDSGWYMAEAITGTYNAWESPTTGNVPSPPWGFRANEWTNGEAISEYENFGKILRDWLAPWRSLPEEDNIVTASETLLNEGAWQINWEDQDLDIVPQLDSWLKDVERDDDDRNYGRAFNAFYDKYGNTREVLSHNLRKRLIDMAGCAAADANAINRAKASVLSLVTALRDALVAAKPEGGGHGEALWDTAGLVASVLPGGGAVDVVKGAIEGAKASYDAATGTTYTFSGERPLEVFVDWVQGAGGLEEFQSDFNDGMDDIVRVGRDILTSLQDDSRSELTPASRTDAVGTVNIDRNSINETKSALQHLSVNAKAPIQHITFGSGQFSRSTSLTNPYDTWSEAQETMVSRLSRMSRDLTDGRDDLIAAVQLMDQADGWSDASLKTLLGFL